VPSYNSSIRVHPGSASPRASASAAATDIDAAIMLGTPTELARYRCEAYEKLAASQHRRLHLASLSLTSSNHEVKTTHSVNTCLSGKALFQIHSTGVTG
jgi:hypothetical protein